MSDRLPTPKERLRAIADRLESMELAGRNQAHVPALLSISSDLCAIAAAIDEAVRVATRKRGGGIRG